jgi:hypothetical protein
VGESKNKGVKVEDIYLTLFERVDSSSTLRLALLLTRVSVLLSVYFYLLYIVARTILLYTNYVFIFRFVLRLFVGLLTYTIVKRLPKDNTVLNLRYNVVTIIV